MIFKKKYLFLILIPLLFLTYPLSYYSNFNITSNSYDNDVPISDNGFLTINDVTTTQNSVKVTYSSSTASRPSYHLNYIKLQDQSDNQKAKKTYSSSGTEIHDSITYTFPNSSSPDYAYKSWKLIGNYSGSNSSWTNETDTIPTFYLISTPDFVSQNLVVDRKKNIAYVDYELDLGSDTNHDSYGLNEEVQVTYNGTVVGTGQNYSSKGTIEIDDINSYDDLDNFILKANTTYNSGTIYTQKVGSPTFVENTGGFTDISSKYSVHEDQLTISYQLYLGNGSDGEYYNLNSSGVSLVNSNNEVLGSDENPSTDYGFLSGEIVLYDYSKFYKDEEVETLYLTATTSEAQEDNNIHSDELDSNIMIDVATATNVWLIVVLVSSFLILLFLIALLFLIKKLNAKRSDKINNTLNA